MAHLRPIDLETWPRREHWRHFRDRVPCSFAITVELDVTEFVAVVGRRVLKVYPAQVWAIATVVNRYEEFRMSLAGAGDPGVWDVVHPCFTIFNAERQTFAAVWTPYGQDFRPFYDAAASVIAQHRETTRLDPQGDRPANSFDLSSLPWTSFTAFSLQVRTGGDHLLPIVTLGRFVPRHGRLLMPVAVQIDHAAADGFHVARLVQDLQQLFDDAADWVR